MPLLVTSDLFTLNAVKFFLNLFSLLGVMMSQSAYASTFELTSPPIWISRVSSPDSLIKKKQVGGIPADTTLKHLERALQLAKKKNSSNQVIKANFELATYYNRHAERANALHYLQQALLSQRQRIDTLTIAIRLEQANIYIDNTDYETGIKTALKAQLLCEQLKMQNSLFMYKVYNALGRLYNNSQNREQALVYSIKGRELAQRLDLRKGLINSLMNLSALYYWVDKRKALETINDALGLAQKMNDLESMGRCLSSMGTIKKSLKQYDAALTDELRALAIHRRLGNTREISTVSFYLANLYHEKKNDTAALDYANEAIRSAEKSNHAANMAKALKLKATLYREQNNFLDALKQMTMYAELKDSILSTESINAVAKIQADYDFDRKESQIQLLRKNLIIQSLRVTRKQEQLIVLQQQRRVNDLRNRLLINQEQLAKSNLKLQTAISTNQQIVIHKQQGSIQKAYHEQALLFVILLLLLVLILVTYLAMRQQTKIKRALLVKKNEITRQAQQLTFLNATKDKLFSIVSHDLRAPAAHLKTNLLKLRQGDGLITPGETLLSLEKQADNLLNLLSNLLDWSYLQLNGFQTVLQPTDVSLVLHNIVQEVNDQLSDKELTLINQFPACIRVLADKRQLAVIMRNLLSNAIKFTPQRGYIRLLVSEAPETIDVQIRDTGIGMDADQVSQLFLNPQVRSGTLGESGTGLGLRLCQDLTTNLGGTLRIDSQPGRGTTAIIKLKKPPVST